MARLPIQGSDDGTWGTILNEFLSIEHNSDGTLKATGSLASKANDNAVVHLSGNETITGTKNFTGTLQASGSAVVTDNDTRLTNQSGYYPSEAYGFFAMSAPPQGNGTSSGFWDIYGGRIWVPAGQAITTVSACVATAGTYSGSGNNGFGVYTDSGALVASALSSTAWASAGWVSIDLDSVIAAQSTGRFVYVLMMGNGNGPAPNIWWGTGAGNAITGGVGMTSTKRHVISYGSGASLPASFDPNTVGSTTNYVPIIGLS